ncbi:MAG TPA: Smr/MutS family protein [Vicinamibacterales bacterium]|jgi:DNA mismatch repair protein MutS2|nr:Smr/MutS family protein [Vicinamibacterales bacterium]
MAEISAVTLRAIEFDRIVSIVAGLAVTPSGRERLEAMAPMTEPSRVAAAQAATSEGVRFLAVSPGFPLRAPSELEAILDGLQIEGRALEPLGLLGLADYLESIEATRRVVASATEPYPILKRLVEAIASFGGEIAAVRRKIEPSGEVADNASPALASIRDRLRRQKSKLRSTLESFLRERDTAKYLQEQVVTDRNGRYVLMVRAEHRGSIPGIVHGASASGQSLFLEPLGTVEINNDVVELEEKEAVEVRRILLELTDTFRARPEDLERTFEMATELDTIQARARFSQTTGGVEPLIVPDGAFELRAARHPLLTSKAVPVDVLMTPPTRVLIIAGPNTGGKTVALKTAGLFAAMAQAGLHLPADKGTKLPVFKSLFADIGDEQSISASLSTFSAHITNVVSMDRGLALPALVLLDEVGAGTDPAEGGALGTAVIDHFRKRGAHLVATTHFDVLKTYASTTEGVESAAFGFDPSTFAPTYRLVYGSPGRSLAIEIASRLGMPASVVAAARGNLSERESQLQAHLDRVDSELHGLEAERRAVTQERAALAENERKLRSREAAVKDRELAARRRLEAKLDDQVRQARKEIDAIIEGLKAKATVLRDKTGQRSAPAISTGVAGAARAEARDALDAALARVKDGAGELPAPEPAEPAKPGELQVGSRVEVAPFGLTGVVLELHGKHADIDMNGKRLRATVADLRVISGPAARAAVRVNVELQPRSGSLSELNLIGCTVDEALERAGRFLDETMFTDQRSVRVVHGYGTGQLRRAIAGFLKHHPLVAHFEEAPPGQGGGGVTVVELKE